MRAGACWAVFFLALSGATFCCAQAVHGEAGKVPAAELVTALGAVARPLTGSALDYDALLAMIGDARVVMLGESTHGSSEFYRERARITERLIQEKGFNAVVLEAGWPAIRRVNGYVLGRGPDANAEQALSDIVRFPRWTWRNADFRDFVQALRRHNQARPAGAAPVGLYGMDLYGAPEAAQAVIRYLEQADRVAAQQARRRYRCFAAYAEEPELYGRDVQARKIKSCRTGARRQAADMERRLARAAARAEPGPDAELYSASQNARLLKASEAYYRALYSKNVSSWNVRDRYMASMLEALMKRIDALGARAKVVVWAHNTHLGDARATDQGAAGELNVGQLMRERHGPGAVLVGLGTYSGTVRAADEWGGADEVKELLPALPDSLSALFHELGMARFVLVLRGDEKLAGALQEGRLERVVGVTYLPHTERESHYHSVRLSRQFDAVIHIDSTRALEPLE